MIHDLKPYSAYKNSGVPWLGEVPAHWEVRRLKYLLQERDTRSVHGSEQLLRVSQYTGVTQRKPAGDGDEPDTRAESLVGYKCVEPNDLVVNIMLAWNGSMGVSQFRGIASPAYCVYRFRVDAHPWYFHYLLRSPTYKARIKAVSTGVVESRLRLYTDDLYRLEALLPPLPEQAAIVRFLDHADRRIRRYICAKQKLIVLLEEQKQAIIHQAVTGQIDVRTGQPYPAYKPSGVEWVGEVPAHWEVRRIKQCVRTISKGTTPSTEGRHILEFGHVRFLKAENITSGEIVDKPLCYIDEDTNNLLRRSQLQRGDILFVIAGATLGKTAVVRQELLPANTNQAVAFIRPHKRIVSSYLAFWLQSPRVKELTWLNAVQSAQPNLSMTNLGNFLVPFSPLPEQAAIVEYLNKAAADIDTAIARARRQIDLLREYRTRLISDVVTGKLDVREDAPRES